MEKGEKDCAFGERGREGERERRKKGKYVSGAEEGTKEGRRKKRERKRKTQKEVCGIKEESGRLINMTRKKYVSKRREK